MKLHLASLLLATVGTSAFTMPQAPTRTSTTTALSSLMSPKDTSELALFPDMPLRRIEGANTLITYKLPIDCERVQMVLKTNGRPMKGKVQLWVGPIRQTHGMDIDVENGERTPFRATLKFKKGGPTLKISASAGLEFPLLAGIQVPTPERNEELAAITQAEWDKAEKTLVQGASVSGGHGAVRTFPIAANVESVQVMIWSVDTGKKSIKAKIELLQGPNNPKQSYDLHLGGGSQPYHAVFETPGEGWMLRIYNKKFIEDGLFEVAVVPYVTGDYQVDPTQPDAGGWWMGR